MTTIIDIAIVAALAALPVVIYEVFKLYDRIPPSVLQVEEEIRHILKWVFDLLIKAVKVIFGSLKWLLTDSKSNNEGTESPPIFPLGPDKKGEYNGFSEAIYRFAKANASKLDIVPPASSTAVRVSDKEVDKISGDLNYPTFKYKLYREKHFDLIHKQEYPGIPIGDIKAKLREELSEYANDAGYIPHGVEAYDEDETKIEARITIVVTGVGLTPDEYWKRYGQNMGNWQN